MEYKGSFISSYQLIFPPQAKSIIGVFLTLILFSNSLHSQKKDKDYWKAKIQQARSKQHSQPDSVLFELSHIQQQIEKEYPGLALTIEMEKALTYMMIGREDTAVYIFQKYLPAMDSYAGEVEILRYKYLSLAANYYVDNESIDIEDLKDLKKSLSRLRDNPSNHALKSRTLWGINNFIKAYYSDLGLWSESLTYLYDQLSLAQNDSFFRKYNYETYYSIGWVYDRLKQYDLAEEFFRKTIVAADSIKGNELLKKDLQARSLHFIGIMYSRRGDTTNWEKYTRLSIQKFQDINNENEIPPLMDLANYYLGKGNFTEAQKLLDRGESILHAISAKGADSSTTDILWANIYQGRANYQYKSGNTREALRYAKLSYQAYDKPETQVKILNEMAFYSAELSDFKGAYEYLSQHVDMYTKEINETEIRKMDDIKRRYQLKEKEKEADYLREQQELQKQELESQRFVIILIVAGLFLMSLVAFFMYRLMRKLRIQSQELKIAKEAAEAGARAKAEFLSVMSHEIRTPMNGVIGMTDLLASTQLNEEQDNFVNTISTSADSLLAIINDILDFSKIESGKMETERLPISIRDCVENILDLFSGKAIESGLEMIHYIEPDVPEGIFGDSVRIKQILSNLVSNAIKFTQEGEIFIRVSMVRDSISPTDTSFKLQFDVRDSGVGISPEKQKRLFKAFSQADASTTRKYGGTGLGLAISAKLSAIMGGDIWVSSEEGKGATFSFTIQTQEAHELPIPIIPACITDLKAKKVLILDDNPTNLTILKLQLEEWEMHVHPCLTGEKALEVLTQQADFDLIISDMNMPDMDGIAFAERAKVLHGSSLCPNILLSSIGETIPNENLFTEVLSKPVKKHKLIHVLLQALGNSHSDIKVKHNKKVHALNKTLQVDTNLSILVAEDNLVNQKLIIKMLARLGYTVDLAENGKVALQKVAEKRYDILFMDVQMPEMDGLTASKHICELYEATERPIIISMTANAMEEDKVACEEAGMVAHLTKPFRSQQLKEILEKFGKKLTLGE